MELKITDNIDNIVYSLRFRVTSRLIDNYYLQIPNIIRLFHYQGCLSDLTGLEIYIQFENIIHLILLQ